MCLPPPPKKKVPLEPATYNEHDAALRALWHALAPTDELVMAERRAAYHARMAQRAASRATRAADRKAEKEAARVARIAARAAAKAQARAEKKEARERRKDAKKAAAAAAAAAAATTSPATAPQAHDDSKPQGEEGGEVASVPTPSADMIENVTMMGFSAEWAVHALHATSLEDSDAAVDFILEHITDMDELVAAAAASRAGSAPTAAPATAEAVAEVVDSSSMSSNAVSRGDDDHDDEDDEVEHDEEEDDEPEEVDEVEEGAAEEEEEEEELEEEPEEAPPTEYTDPEGGGSDVASSHRFARCGLSGVGASTPGSTSFAASALDELRGGGLLVVTCLTHLCKRYPHTAPRLLAHAAGRAASKARRSHHSGAVGTVSTNGNNSSVAGSNFGSDCNGTAGSRGSAVDDERGVSVASVSVQCLRCVAEVLHLTPTPLFSDVSPSSVARTNVWQLLDHPACVETLFALAVHVFDDWTTGGAGASSALFDLSSRMGATHATLKELVHGNRKGVKNAQPDGYGYGGARGSMSHHHSSSSSSSSSGLSSGGGFASPRDVWAAWAAGADDRVTVDGELPPLLPPPPVPNVENGPAATGTAARNQEPPPARPPPALAMGLASLGRLVTGAGSEVPSPPPPSEAIGSESSPVTVDFNGETSEF